MRYVVLTYGKPTELTKRQSHLAVLIDCRYPATVFPRRSCAKDPRCRGRERFRNERLARADEVGTNRPARFACTHCGVCLRRVVCCRRRTVRARKKKKKKKRKKSQRNYPRKSIESLFVSFLFFFENCRRKRSARRRILTAVTFSRRDTGGLCCGDAKSKRGSLISCVVSKKSKWRKKKIKKKYEKSPVSGPYNVKYSTP